MPYLLLATSRSEAVTGLMPGLSVIQPMSRNSTRARARLVGSFGRLTVLPLCAKILGAVAQGLSGWFEGAELRVDLDRVPALAEDRMALWREVSAADWLTAD